METLVHNIEKVGHISSRKLYSYLEQNGWTKKGEAEGVSVWTYKKENEMFGILVPFNEDFVDYKNRVFEVLCTLEKVEGRPFSKILQSLQGASTLAQIMHREIIELRIKFNIEEKYEISSRKLSYVMKSLQDFFESLGDLKIIHHQTSLKNNEVKEELEVFLIETFQGSFGFRLGFATPQYKQLNLFDSSIAENVSQDFLELIQASSDSQSLEEKIALYHGQSSIKFKKFLSNLLSLDASLYIEWGSANPAKGGVAEISHENIVQALDIISEQEIASRSIISFTGRLIVAGADSKKKNTRFVVVDLTDENHNEYTGYISQLVINSNIDITVGKIFKISLQRTSEINRATGNEEVNYIMVGLEKI